MKFNKPTIFISIAAYEDPSLIKTINSALNNADNPENIHFGIGLQYEKEPDLSSFKNMKTISWVPKDRPGIVRIRYEISKLFDNQDYYLQIDSHYVFAESWDTILLDTIKEIQSRENTHRIFLFPLDGFNGEVMTSRWAIHRSQDSRNVQIHVVPENGKMKSPEPGTILPIPYMRVGQLFFDGRYIAEVGLDEWSQLGYEQAYLGFKSFLSGWDAYAIYELNLLVQDDTDYLKIKQRLGDKFLGGPNIKDNDQTYYEFTLAFLFNNYSKYMVPNALRTPEEFWLMQGEDQHKAFLDAKSDAIKYLRNIAQ